MRTRCWGGCGRTLTYPGMCVHCTWLTERIAAESTEARDEREEVPVDADRE